MRRAISYIIYFGVCLCFISCVNKEVEQGDTPTNTPTATLYDENEWTPIGEKEIPSEVPTMTVGKKIEDLQVKGQEDAYMCNLTENYICTSLQRSDYSVMVCKDPVYDLTYYVNRGRDNYIYMLRDGKRSLAVEIRARDLYCRNGKLYFIADQSNGSADNGFSAGNVLCYDPITGQIEVIIDEKVSAMRVFQDEIHYQIREALQADSCVKFYSFSERKTVQSFYYTGIGLKPMLLIDRWNDKNIVFNVFSECYSYEASEDEYEDMVHINDVFNYFRIVNDKLYYTSSNECPYWGVIDMTTGKKEDVTADVPSGAMDLFVWKDYVIFEGLMWYSVSDGSWRTVRNAKEDENRQKFQQFYTDGEHLFGIAENKLWIIEVEEEKDGGNADLVIALIEPDKLN